MTGLGTILEREFSGYPIDVWVMKFEPSHSNNDRFSSQVYDVEPFV